MPLQRSTTHGPVPRERVEASFGAAPLTAIVNTSAHKYERDQPLELVRPGLA